MEKKKVDLTKCCATFDCCEDCPFEDFDIFCILFYGENTRSFRELLLKLSDEVQIFKDNYEEE